MNIIIEKKKNISCTTLRFFEFIFIHKGMQK
jgi:hypothetical protein